MWGVWVFGENEKNNKNLLFFFPTFSFFLFYIQKSGGGYFFYLLCISSSCLLDVDHWTCMWKMFSRPRLSQQPLTCCHLSSTLARFVVPRATLLFPSSLVLCCIVLSCPSPARWTFNTFHFHRLPIDRFFFRPIFFFFVGLLNLSSFSHY